jgi:HYR domain
MIRSSLLGLAVLLVLAGGAAAAPIFSVPGDMTVEAAGAAGSVVSYEASATNPAGHPIAITCVPGSGSTFPLGATTVTCTAVEEGETATATFTITVVDTTAPAIGSLAAVSVEAVGPAGAPVAYSSPSAVDAVDGPVPVACAPASGSTFAVGTTTVSCTASDSRGNTVTSTGSVAVVDTTPPTISVPAPATVAATTPSGIAASDPQVTAFLASATATDVVTPAPTITHDAPGVFPVGTTTVRFTAADSSGNTVSATTTLSVTPIGTPPGSPSPSPTSPPSTPPATTPPATADRTPPGNVTGVRARAASGTVSIAWKAPPDADFSHVRILRSVAADPAASPVNVYEGAANTFRDTRLRNGTQYRYLIISYDRAGNRSGGVAFSVRPKANLLLAPADGARVVRPPLLVWAKAAGATYYNVQLFRGRTKILSAWPTARRLVIPASWRFAGRRQRLTPGTYRWYVWPGFGARAAAEFGEVLGTSTFTLVER